MKKHERVEIVVEPVAETAGQHTSSTPAKHISPGGFSVPAEGLGRTGTLTSQIHRLDPTPALTEEQ